MKTIIKTAAVVAVLALTACGGGGGSSFAGATPQRASTSPIAGAASIPVTLIVPAKTVASNGRAAKYVSPATKSIAFIAKDGAGVPLGAGTAQVFDVQTGTNTFSVQTQQGAVGFSVSAYSGASATGSILSATYVPFVRATVAVGKPTTISLALGGVAAKISATLAHPFFDGVAATNDLFVTAYDASGNQIIGSDPYSNGSNDVSYFTIDPPVGGRLQLINNGVPANGTLRSINPSDHLQVAFDGTHLIGGSVANVASFAPVNPLTFKDASGNTIGKFALASVPSALTVSATSARFDSLQTSPPIVLSATGSSTVNAFSDCAFTSRNNQVDPHGIIASLAVTQGKNSATATLTPNAAHSSAPATCLVEFYTDFGSINGVTQQSFVVVSVGPANGPYNYSNSVTLTPDALIFADAKSASQDITVAVSRTPVYTGPIGASTIACVLPTLDMQIGATTSASNIVPGDDQKLGPVATTPTNGIVKWTPTTVGVVADSPVTMTFAPVAPGLCAMGAGPGGDQPQFPASVGY